MSATETMTIKTRVSCRVLAGKKNGRPQFEDIPAGAEAVLPVEQALDLIRMKAAAAVDAKETLQAPGPNDDPAEAERLKILDEARKLGVKGLRKDSPLDTIKEKLEAFLAEKEGEGGSDEDGDVL